MLGKAAGMEWNQSKKEVICASGRRAGEVGLQKSFEAQILSLAPGSRYGATRYGVCLAGFQSYFDLLLPCYDSILSWVINCLESQKRFRLLNCARIAKDYKDFWSWTGCILYYEMAMSLWRQQLGGYGLNKRCLSIKVTGKMGLWSLILSSKNHHGYKPLGTFVSI